MLGRQRVTPEVSHRPRGLHHWLLPPLSPLLASRRATLPPPVLQASPRPIMNPLPTTLSPPPSNSPALQHSVPTVVQTTTARQAALTAQAAVEAPTTVPLGVGKTTTTHPQRRATLPITATATAAEDLISSSAAVVDVATPTTIQRAVFTTIAAQQATTPTAAAAAAEATSSSAPAAPPLALLPAAPTPTRPAKAPATVAPHRLLFRTNKPRLGSCRSSFMCCSGRLGTSPASALRC